MSWDALVGQQPAKKYLRSVLSAKRNAHAYLFSGPSGVGKRTAALLFAQVLLCHAPPFTDTACGICKSCHWFQNRRGPLLDHPDVISLVKFSGSSEKGGGAEKIVADQDPMIRLETIQHVCEQLHRSPMAGARRVVIIPEVQRLCRGQAEAANAFLKTLEEPPESSLIILTTSQPEALLETIISRVQYVQFRRLSLDDIRAGLALQSSSQPQAEREVAALLSDGSLGRAKELLEGDLKTWRAAVITGLGKLSVKAGPQFGLMLWGLADTEGKRLFAAEKDGQKCATAETEDDPSDELSEGEAKTESGWKRYVFRRLLEVLEVCFRDAMVCAAAPDAGAPLLLQPDQRELSHTLAAKFGTEGCQRILASLRDCLLAVRLYVRGDVVGRALSGKIVEAMQSAA